MTTGPGLSGACKACFNLEKRVSEWGRKVPFWSVNCLVGAAIKMPCMSDVI